MKSTCRPGLRRAAAHGVFAALILCAGPAPALEVDEARHLLTRTGFGAAPHEIRALLPLTRQQAVDRVLASLDAPPDRSPPPAFVAQPLQGYAQRLGAEYLPPSMAEAAAADAEQEDQLTRLGMQEMEQLRVWWLDRMISTRSPLAERLALMWHGHFTSKYFDVLGPRLMYDQLQTLRRLGSHSFADLMRAMLRDPAMLIFLDNAFNTRAKPNENLARELLELFALGTGHYSEDDVKVLGRKLAGHGVDFEGDWRYRVDRRELDLEPRPFLGRTVRTLAEAEQAVLDHPQSSRWIAERFYREFVADRLDAAEVERLAAILRREGHAVRPMLRALLSGQAFWSPDNRGALVKSPVELLVGTVRTFGLPLPDAGRLAQDSRLLGQELFEPPTVKGWRRGMAWLNMAALRQRSEGLQALWRCREAAAQVLDAGPDDLLLRFSSELAGPGQAHIVVRVDGTEVAAVRPRCPADLGTQPAGEGSFKPAWDLLWVPRSALAARPRLLEVAFQREAGVQANAFVNWVQVDRLRLPAALAEQVYDAGEPCSGQEPKGMLYCNGRMRFDLAQLRRSQRGQDPTLYDRVHGSVNSVIEGATTRMPLQLRPAARAPADPRTPGESWRGLPLTQALLPVPPMNAPGPDTDPLPARLEALLLDPAFNLK